VPYLTIAGDTRKRLTYRQEGEGFPLLLVPAQAGRIADWAPQLPLLGELCRVMAYEYGAATDIASPCSRVRDVQAILDGLAIERAYLAGYADGGLTALGVAWRYPQQVEGLLLIGMDRVGCEDRLGRIRVPTCAFAGAEASRHIAVASHLAATLSYGETSIIRQAATAPHQEQPLTLGHAMMDFLMRCERQRNLVRGASFLL
jgi:pimeloyl-ACP methyl ester carboxylesterase